MITSAHVIPVRLRTKTLSAENVPAGDAAPGGNRSLFSLRREGAGGQSVRSTLERSRHAGSGPPVLSVHRTRLGL